MRQQARGCEGQSLRQAFHPRGTSSRSGKLFKVGAQGSEAVGSNIVRSGPAAIERQHIEVHQIMGVNELDPISATADDIDVPVFPYPLEPYLENSQTSRSHCCAGEIGREHVCTPVPNAHLVCRLQLEYTKPHQCNNYTLS